MHANQSSQAGSAVHSVGRIIASALVVTALVVGLLCLLAGLVPEVHLVLTPAAKRGGPFVAIEVMIMLALLMAGMVVLWSTFAVLRWGFSPRWPVLIHRLSLCIGVVALLAGAAAPFAGLEWGAWIISPGTLGLAALTWWPPFARLRTRRMRQRSEPSPAEADANESFWSPPTKRAAQEPSVSNRTARSVAGLVAAVCLLTLGLLFAVAAYMSTFDDGHRPAEPEAQIGAGAGNAITMTVCPILAVICVGSGWWILRRLFFSSRNLPAKTPTSSQQ